jgi:hypothetical protein
MSVANVAIGHPSEYRRNGLQSFFPTLNDAGYSVNENQGVE